MNRSDSRTALRSSRETIPASEIGEVGWRNHPLDSSISATNMQYPPHSFQQQHSSNDIPSTKGKRVSNAPYSFECPVSSEALKLVDPEYRHIDEFKSCTYTPVICKPEDFTLENGYSLRQNRNGRSTEILIACTMYNESEEFLSRTLSAVFKNIRYFCELNKDTRHPDNRHPSIAVGTDDKTFVKGGVHSNVHLESGLRGDQMWTKHGWQKIVVVIISDGRKKINERAKKMLQAMGIYQDELIMPQIVDPLDETKSRISDVTAHLFEYTCQAIMDENVELKYGTRSGVFPVQVLFCLKEKNAKKLNSHKWLFRAFAPLLNPNICVLIDVGTRPKSHDAIYHLWKAFDRNQCIAGAAGEICVMLGKNCEAYRSISHPMIASQNFEYKMSNILDKTLESCFGYISVLPGAFSAYRWEALQDSDPEHGPLISYFKGETPRPKGNVFASNMYLAEDRILCFELVAKKDSKWLLHYVKDARAETDVPTGTAEFISQRRRWLNGTFFCQIYAIAHLARLWRTRHSFLQKVAFTIQFLYLAVILVYSWFGIANFYLSFYLLTSQTISGQSVISAQWQEFIFYLFRSAYLCVMISQFVCSLGNRPQGAESIFAGSMVIFAIIMIFIFIITGLLIYESFATLPPGQSWIVSGGTSRDMIISISSTYGVYFLSSLIYGEFSHIFSCIFQYMLLLPSYVNTLTIYAFCNTHDVSWGTKGDNQATSGPVKKLQSAEELKEINTQKFEPPHFTEAELSKFYSKAFNDIRVIPTEQVDVIDPGTKREDYYKNFRTRFVLFWVLSNGLLVAIISSPQAAKSLIGDGNANYANPYMQFIMYSVAIFSIIRFGGCVVYMILRAVRHY